MRRAKRITAALMCGTVLLTVCPLNPVLAADDSAASEPVTMDCVVTLNGTTATASNDKVQIEGGKITIAASGAYEFSGTLEDGQIYVNVPDKKTDTGTVKLFFKGVNITGKSNAAVLIDSAKNTSINLVDGTENIINDGETYPEKVTAAIYAKDDLTIKASGEAGDGKLRVEAKKQHGIHCAEELKITGGNIKVKADAEDGVRGKESVEIKGGKLDVNADGDGVKSTKGNVIISGGKTEVKAGKDAIQGELSVLITGGDVKANGDRGITNVGAAPEKKADDDETPTAVTGITISGGTVFATATKDVLKEGQAETELKDNSFKIDPKPTQPVLLVTASELQLKDQRVELKNQASGASVISKNASKKFDYILFSSPDLKVGETYSVFLNEAAAENGTIKMESAITSAENIINTNKPTVSEGDPYDINGDGSVDVSDVVLLCRFVVADEGIMVTDAMVARMDVDGNGRVEPNDATKILRRIARID